MTIKFEFVYDDGKKLVVDVNEDKAKEFVDSLSNRNVFWNSPESPGFWTEISKVRYFLVHGSKDTEQQKIGMKIDEMDV